MVLLSNEQQCAIPETINYCSGLLNKFVADSINLYGQQFVSANVHNLIHLTDDVRNFGPLDSFSAYPFENFLQKIKNLVRKSAKPLQQIVKRLSELEINKVIVPNLQEEEVALYDEHYSGPTYNIVGKQYKSMKFKFWKLGRTKPNNCVYLNDQSIVIIENFVKRNNAQLFIVGRKFENVSDLYPFPINSSQLGIYVVIQLGNLDVWALSDINCKGFIIPSFISPDSFVVSPLLAHNHGLV